MFVIALNSILFGLGPKYDEVDYNRFACFRFDL